MTGAPTPAPTQQYVLRLFVTGATPRSVRAIANLRDVLQQELPGQYELEVIDIYQDPAAASRFQIIAAPTLLKVLPEPVRRIIGDLPDMPQVLRGLGLEPTAGGVHEHPAG